MVNLTLDQAHKALKAKGISNLDTRARIANKVAVGGTVDADALEYAANQHLEVVMSIIAFNSEA